MKTVVKNEQGMAHLALVLIAVVVVAVVGFTGYKVASKNKTGSSNGSNTSTSSTTSGSSAASSAASDATCLATYHDANICHFAANSNINKIAYEATLNTTDPSGSASTMTLKADGKGNTQLSGTGNGASLNSITLNGTVYTEDTSTGVWLEYTGASVPPADQSDPASNMDIGVGNAGVTFKPEGKAPCQDMTCYKYAVSVAATPGTTQTVLFDTASYKLREWDYSSSSQGSIVMTVSYPNVNITAPSPVQKISVGQ
jgi:hypothetical protein